MFAGEPTLSSHAAGTLTCTNDPCTAGNVPLNGWLSVADRTAFGSAYSTRGSRSSARSATTAADDDPRPHELRDLTDRPLPEDSGVPAHVPAFARIDSVPVADQQLAPGPERRTRDEQEDAEGQSSAHTATRHQSVSPDAVRPSPAPAPPSRASR